MLLDLMEEDGLLVTARGLGLDRILLNAIHSFCSPKNLILVLNTSSFEEQYFINELNMLGVELIPKIITNEYGTSERESIYLKGGVLFVTSRILVVDMLMKRLPIHLVTGILVHRAHKLGESSQEAFILRLFRQGNREGFIKALSDAPVSFVSGFCKVERVMRNLFVKKLFLRPRFHADVASSLEKEKPEVEELHISMTPGMNGIQIAVVELIDLCLKDLKKSNPTLDPEEVTLENSLTATFDKILKISLDHQWNQLSGRTKQLVADIKVLRTILAYLTQYDCITFNNFLTSLRSHESEFMNKSLWMFMDAANSLFVCARERVFGKATSKDDKKSSKDDKKSSKDSMPTEVVPKWEALVEILKEIDETSKAAGPSIAGRVLICASDERTCFQLRQVLCNGALPTLKQMLDRNGLLSAKSAQNEKGDTSKSKNSSKHRNDQPQFKKRKLNDIKKDCLESNIDEDQLAVLPYDSVILIHALKGNSDPYSLLRKLNELEPTYVILYDMQMEFVRQLEVFKASRPGIPLRVYCLIYSGSVEEQRYLTVLRKEKDAFEVLIRQKASMVIPEERDARSSVGVDMLRESASSVDALNTRKAGGRNLAEKSTPKVIVDMREFRSELPSLIHRRGMDIEPVTLEVGDYILSPDICVERKSISDLIGSLNSGRLYNQALAMTRFYKRAILLIEFEESKSFSLQSKNSLSDNISMQNISSKLALLTIHFPKLRIIWSQSPQLTAEIFEDLKQGREEPRADVAIAIGVDASETSSDIIYSLVPQDFVRKLPGIDSRNYRRILNKVGNIEQLFSKTEEELSNILGNAKIGKSLYQFVNNKEEKNDADVSNSK